MTLEYFLRAEFLELLVLPGRGGGGGKAMASSSKVMADRFAYRNGGLVNFLGLGYLLKLWVPRCYGESAFGF